MNLITDFPNLKYYFSIPIGTIYGLFFTKLINVLLEYEQKQALCEDIKYKEPGYDSCRKQRNEMITEFKTKRFNIMMIIGMVGIVLGVILHSQNVADGRLSVAGAGLSLGGVLILIYYIIENWHRMNELSRVIVTGAVLLSLIMSSYFLMA
jgi:hypothetical protein